MNKINKTIEDIRNEKAHVAEQRQIIRGVKELSPILTKGEISDIAEVLQKATDRELGVMVNE